MGDAPILHGEIFWLDIPKKSLQSNFCLDNAWKFHKESNVRGSAWEAVLYSVYNNTLTNTNDITLSPIDSNSSSAFVHTSKVH